MICFNLVTEYLGSHSISLARPLTITLGRSRLVGLGYDLASYVLDSFDDCVARREFFLFYRDPHHSMLTITSVFFSNSPVTSES